MSDFYPASNVDPLYPVIDTDFLPAVPQRVTQSQVVQFAAYEHTQSAASTTWTIIHNLTFYPNVTVIDTAGTMVEAEITYPNKNQLTITFTTPVAGVAYLS